MRWLIIAIALVLSEAAANEPALQVAQAPPGIGKIDPIKGDLVLRYRPIAAVTYVQSVSIDVVIDGKTQNFRGDNKIRLSIDSNGNLIAFHFALLEQSDAGTPTDAKDIATINLITDDRGNPRSISGDVFIPKQGRYLIDKLSASDKAMVMDSVKRYFPPYPESGIKTGDVVFAVSLNKLFPTDALGWNTTGGSAVAKLQGISKINGRAVAVLNWDSDVSVNDTRVNAQDVSFTLSGYSLIDISSGIPAGYNLSGHGFFVRNKVRTDFSLTAQTLVTY